MGNTYDDSKYGIITREWFGLVKRLGGENPNSTGGFSISSGTSTSFVARWYPKGPVTIKKVGYRAQTALGGASRTRQMLRFKTNNANDVIANIKPTTTTVSQYTLASTTSLTTNYVTAGSYVAIDGRPVKNNAANTLSGNAVTGTFALFIDWVPKYSTSFDV